MSMKDSGKEIQHREVAKWQEKILGESLVKSGIGTYLANPTSLVSFRYLLRGQSILVQLVQF